MTNKKRNDISIPKQLPQISNHEEYRTTLTTTSPTMHTPLTCTKEITTESNLEDEAGKIGVNRHVWKAILYQNNWHLSH